MVLAWRNLMSGNTGSPRDFGGSGASKVEADEASGRRLCGRNAPGLRVGKGWAKEAMHRLWAEAYGARWQEPTQERKNSRPVLMADLCQCELGAESEDADAGLGGRTHAHHIITSTKDGCSFIRFVERGYFF